MSSSSPVPTTDDAVVTRSGLGRAAGTCGELLQGVLPCGRAFHVTCPITLGSTARVTIEPARGHAATVIAPGRVKTANAVGLAAARLDLFDARIDVAIESSLPPAKGMGTSTADIVAALRALAQALETELSGAELAQLATSVEPSDGVMFDGIVAMDHHTGTVLRRWADSPKFWVAAFIPADRYDTDLVPAVDRSHDAEQYARLLDRLDIAMRGGRLDEIAAVATTSARLNQQVHPNPLWPLLSPHAHRRGAMGLCVGHSGTVAGLLFQPGAIGADEAERAVAALLPHAPARTEARVVRMR